MRSRSTLATIAAALFLFPLLAGCLEDNGRVDGGDGDGTPPPSGGQAPPAQPATRTLAEGTQSGLTGPVRELLDSEQAWTDLWAEHASQQVPPPQRPAVDFARERVVAVVLEDKPNGCYGARVTNVTHAADGSLVVEVTTYEPEPGLMCASVITQPFHFVAVESRAQAAAFDETTTQGAPSEGAGSGARCLPEAPECDDTPGSDPVGDGVEWRTLDQGTYSAIDEERRVVLETAEEWETFWAEHNRGRTPTPERPEVDFASERVVAILLGSKPSSGYDVEVTRIVEDESTLRVEYEWTAPAEGQGSLTVITVPYHFVAIPRAGSDGQQVVFIENGPAER